MSGPDLLIVGAYLLAMLAMSAWFARGQAGSSDYYLGGRRLPWWALGLSTLATQSSANSFIGIPAFVALVPGGGLTWLQYELALPLALLVIMRLFVPVFRGLGLISIYEYLELRFDRPTRLLLSAVFLGTRALASGVALYAAAVVVQVCTGIALPACVLVVGAVTVAYDMMGGMRAVVWTDVVQMVLMVVGVVLCIGYAVQHAGGAAAVLAAVEPARLAAIDAGHGLGDGARAPLWGFVVGGVVLYVAYYGVDQSQVQRQLAAASVADAHRLLLFNGLARFPLTLLYALLGLALAAVWATSPALRAAVPADRLDFLVPRFIEQQLPVGLRGLLVAAILAAAMSSLDSSLNSLSAATMRDFVAHRVGAGRQLLASRLCTLGWGLVITVVGLQAGDLASSVIEAINRVGALFYGPLLAAFACGVCDARARGAAVRAGVAMGLLANVLLWAWLGPALFWMWWNVSGLLVAALVTTLLSRLMPPAAAPAARTLRGQVGAGSGLPRGAVGLLLGWTALIAALLAALGVRG
jgi:SSS family transporter